MRRSPNLVIAVVLAAPLCILPVAVQAQNHPERRAIEKTAPVFPELAKRAHIKGVVKMEVVVRPNGSVKSTKVLGGNPVLIDAASDAVHKWKFEAAAEETTEIVQIEFAPR